MCSLEIFEKVSSLVEAGATQLAPNVTVRLSHGKRSVQVVQGKKRCTKQWRTKQYVRQLAVSMLEPAN